jgi:hypothetical protein
MFRPLRFLALAWLGVLPAGLTLIAAPAEAVTVHLKAGFSAATLHGELPVDPFVTRGMRKGVGGGLAVSIPVRHGFSIQPELLYVMKGTTMGEVEFTDAFGNPTGQVATVIQVNDYLEVPVLARIDLPMRGASPPWLLVGPAVGFRLSNDFVVTGEPGMTRDLASVRPVDVGLALGLGAALGRVSLETRYTLGLTTAGRPTTASQNGRNGALLAMVGFALRP